MFATNRRTLLEGGEPMMLHHAFTQCYAMLFEKIKRLKEKYQYSSKCVTKRVPDRKRSQCNPISADIHKHPQLLGMGLTNPSA